MRRESRELVQAQEYFDALKEIASYIPAEKLRREAQEKYGLSGDEALEMALEMAYDNIIEIAKATVKGRRRPASEYEASRESQGAKRKLTT